MNLKSIAERIAATVVGERIIADDDEVCFSRDGGPDPSDLLLLSDNEGRGLGKYRVVVEPVDPSVPMDFPAALRAAKTGARIARTGWNGKGMHVRLMSAFGMDMFLALHPTEGYPVPWVTSQTDVLAEDWVVVLETEDGLA